MDEIILRAIVIQPDGRAVEVFRALSPDVHREHVALMREPKVGKPDKRGLSEIVLGYRFGVDADELLRLLSRGEDRRRRPRRPERATLTPFPASAGIFAAWNGMERLPRWQCRAPGSAALREESE